MSISHSLLELVERFGNLSTSLERCRGVRIERCKKTGSGLGSQRQRALCRRKPLLGVEDILI